MQLKIILILSGLLALVLLGFQSYRLGIANKTIKEKDTQINSMVKQNQANLEDLSKRNEEVKQANEKANILQQKIDKIRQSNSDKCFNSLLSDDVMQLLQSNGIK